MYKFRGPLLSLCIFFVGIAIVELLLRIFAPVPDPYNKYHEQLNQYIKTEFDPDLSLTTILEEEMPGSDGQPNIFSTNNMGFRGDDLITPKPKNEYRIFLMGASSAVCYYLDDSESLDAVIQRNLKGDNLPSGLSVKVYNAGQLGANTDDIISMIVHRIVHLGADMIILFSADLLGPVRDLDYLHYLPERPKKKYRLLHLLATEFQIPRRLFYIIKSLDPSEHAVFETVTLESEYSEAIEKMRNAPVSENRPKTNIPGYSKNIRTIIGTAKAHDIKLVFMTLQSTWNSKVDPEARNWHYALYYNGNRYREDYMEEVLESYRNELRRLSAEYSVPLYDLAKTMPKSTEYFYSDVYFNAKGAQYAGERLAAFILQKGLIRR